MLEVLRNLCEGLADLVEASKPSIVQVVAGRRVPATGIVWSPDGLVITAHHVIRRDEDIVIKLPGGEIASATLVGRDPTTDVAVLRAEAVEIHPPTWDGGDDLRIGEMVLALGYPRDGVQAAMGIISALDGSWLAADVGGEIDRYLQTDVRMYPGFSGGPLVRMKNGEVLGLNTSKLVKKHSMTIPINTLLRVVDVLVTHGRIRYGYLGIGKRDARLPEGPREKLGRELGVLVTSVRAETPADQGGLMVGDIIVSFNHKPARTDDELGALLTEEVIGRETPMSVVRGGQLKELLIVADERR